MKRRVLRNLRTLAASSSSSTVAAAADHVQVVVIGAGVIGLAVARALAKAEREVLLLERANTIGSETSSRNSEVVHAGIYYPQHSLKAKFCVQGNERLYQYCESRNISYRKCGKLVVATHQQQWERDLPRLHQSALQNGVDTVRIMTRDDVKVMEPELDGIVGALWSPSSGVLDSHALFMSLLADAEAHGATIALRTNVEGGKVGTATSPLHTLKADGIELTCDAIVNCAGLRAHHIAAILHHSDTSPHNPQKAWQPPMQYFAKGSYFRLQGRKNPFHHLVYPIPEEGGLGVHSTTDWSGLTVKFGPDVEWIDPTKLTDPDDIDLNPNPAREESFYEAIRHYWPHLEDDALVPDYAGIRPKLYHPRFPLTATAANKDFLIVGPRDVGVSGIIHLFGIESPGLTSSMAIADHVVELLHDK